MLYVQQSLGPNEELVHVGQFHWMYTFNAFLSILWGIAGSLLVIIAAVFAYKQLGKFPANLDWVQAMQYLHPGIRIVSFVIFVFGLLGFAHKMVIRATTEIAITNSRIVFKKGLIARQVGELSIDRIEGVTILQSVCGRMFNYGRLAIRGMGIGEVVLPPISDPIMFRQAIEKARAI
ncbi:MAG: PH domain-containing protein [Alphaproteobacteria bacterium]